MSVPAGLDARVWTPAAATGRPLVRDSPRLVVVVLVVAAAAWAATLALHGADGAALADHRRLGVEPHEHPGGAHDHPSHGPGPAGQALLVLGGWALMVVAMMLPPALPLLAVVGRLVARRPHPRLLLLAGTATFVAAWTVVGAVLVAGDALLHRLTAAAPPSWPLDALVPGAVLVGAGAFQLSGLKRRCLRACRSPRGFAVAHWRRRRPALVEAATVSGAYALSCIGCCWALMAVGFAVGVAALPVMVALAVLMAAERLLPWGRRLVRPSAVVLALLGAAVALRPLVAAGLAG